MSGCEVMSKLMMPNLARTHAVKTRHKISVTPTVSAPTEHDITKPKLMLIELRNIHVLSNIHTHSVLTLPSREAPFHEPMGSANRKSNATMRFVRTFT